MINIFWDPTINDWNIATRSNIGARCKFNLDKDDYKQRFNLDQVFSKTHDPMLSRYDFIEPCDIIEGWVDDYMRMYP